MKVKKIRILRNMKRLSLKFALYFIFIGSSFTYAAEDIKLQGELTQGSLLIGKVTPGSHVSLDGKELDVTRFGEFVFGFGRDSKLDHQISWKDPHNTLHIKNLKLKKRQYKTQKVDGVPQKTVTPSQDKLARIRAETALVKAARETRSMHRYFLQAFIAPFDGPVTGVYGSQRIYNGTPKRPHFGLDYAGPVGALIHAPANGVVTLTHDDMFYSGGTLILDHGHGVSSTFIHLSELLVHDGQEIKQGDVIAKVGAGGRSTGPHLDWRVNWYDVRIDPQKVLGLNSL